MLVLKLFFFSNRAKILSDLWDSETIQYQVLLLDVGKELMVSETVCYKITKEFAEFSPPMAIRCHLHDVKVRKKVIF